MFAARGFTLIELMIALLLASAISVALVVAFRLGVDYLERGRSYYGELQETLAVVNHLRRSVGKVAASKLGGDGHTLRLGSNGFACEQDDAGPWRLETGNLPPEPQSTRDQARAQLVPQVAAATAPANNTPADASPDTDKPKLDLLLDALDSCAFEFLVAQAPPGPDLPNNLRPATPDPNAPPPDNATYSWQATPDKGKPVAVRITLATHGIAFPPIVLKPAG